MEIVVQQGDVVRHETSALVVNLFEGVRSPGGATGAVDQALGGLISRLIEDGEIRGKKGELTLLHTPSSAYPGFSPERVLVVGLGSSSSFDYEGIRSISASAARKLRSIRVRHAATIAHGAGIGGLDAAGCAEAIAEGTLLGLYRFTRYKSGPDGDDAEEDSGGNGLDILELIEFEASRVPQLRRGVELGSVLASAALLARDLVNEPPNVLSPTELARAAQEMAGNAGLECKVLGSDECERLGMGAFLAVAKGSAQPPKFIHISYRGDPSNRSNNLWLVGKGITFDSGGLSLKPSAGMPAMKGDMGGGAAVIGAMKAIAALKPKLNVDGVCAATENMPGGSAQRPSDIVKAMNGKWIEVENTDAEGRLTLADAICYARENGAARIVDIATLTGAISVALGRGHTGGFSNNDELMEAVAAAGATRGEPVWRLPLDSISKRQNSSRVADIKNTGGRPAGSITAAHFIHEFAGSTPWVHLDIAAVNMSDGNSGVFVPGATGAAARTLVQLATDLAKDPGSV